MGFYNHNLIILHSYLLFHECIPGLLGTPESLVPENEFAQGSEAAVEPGSGLRPGEQEQVLLSEVAVLNLWRLVLAKRLPVIIGR